MQQPLALSPHQVSYCMECGVCTASCPVSRTLESFSPRQIIKRTLMDEEASVVHSREIWACLTCGRCSARCPVEIDFPGFNRSLRERARQEGNLPLESHHGILQTVAAIQSRGLGQNRTAWAKEAGIYRESGEIYYFVGCLPYFEVIFQYLEISPLKAATSSLRLLNRMGIEPVISNQECCCGHDAFWSGQMETFLQLAKRNVETISKTGAERVLFTCPEGYTIFKDHYPEHLGELPFEVLHMTDFLAKELPGAALDFSPEEAGPLTFQDPCRLGRFAGLYEPPRELVGLIPGARLVEMDRNRENAMCCGTSAWMECSKGSKSIRVERLNEAVSAGAKTVLTACPKCHIHLTCSKTADELDVEVVDLYSYLHDHLA